jgi:hypothetical protein
MPLTDCAGSLFILHQRVGLPPRLRPSRSYFNEPKLFSNIFKFTPSDGREAALALNADGYLLEPLCLEQLFAAAERHCRPQPH